MFRPCQEASDIFLNENITITEAETNSAHRQS